MITEWMLAVARRVDGLLDATDVDEARDPQLVAAAISALRARGAAALDAATPYLWEYYRDMAAVVGTGEDGVPDIPAGSDIWEHVELSRPPIAFLGGTALEPSPCYLSFEGEVAWEPEHGLQLVYDLGGAVCKVGPYDGHVTVAHAFGDPGMLDTIYG